MPAQPGFTVELLKDVISHGDYIASCEFVSACHVCILDPSRFDTYVDGNCDVWVQAKMSSATMAARGIDFGGHLEEGQNPLPWRRTQLALENVEADIPQCGAGIDGKEAPQRVGVKKNERSFNNERLTQYQRLAF